MGSTLVAAGAPSEESALLSARDGVTSIDLRVSESVVGQLRFRAATDLPAFVRNVRDWERAQ